MEYFDIMMLNYAVTIVLLLVTYTYSQSTSTQKPDSGATEKSLAGEKSGVPTDAPAIPAATDAPVDPNADPFLHLNNPEDIDHFAVNLDPFASLFGDSQGINTFPSDSSNDQGVAIEGNGNIPVVTDNTSPPAGGTTESNVPVETNDVQPVVPVVTDNTSPPAGGTTESNVPVETNDVQPVVPVVTDNKSPPAGGTTESNVPVETNDVQPVVLDNGGNAVDDFATDVFAQADNSSDNQVPNNTVRVDVVVPIGADVQPVVGNEGPSPVVTVVLPNNPNEGNNVVPINDSVDTPAESDKPAVTKESEDSVVVNSPLSLARPKSVVDVEEEDILKPVVLSSAPVTSVLDNEEKWLYLCKKCDSIDQVCNFPHPTDCQMFIECFRQGNVWRATPMMCGHGTFFSTFTHGCDHAYLAKCKYDKCLMTDIHMYKHKLDRNCATYWACNGKMSKPACCPDGKAYVEGFGCVEDENCTAQCPNSKNVTVQAATEFGFKDDGKCKTNVYLNFEQPTITNESPKHKVVFVKSSNKEVTISDGHGVFKGDSYLFVPYYNHNDFQVKEAFIQLRFKPYNEGSDSQVLVSTCSTNYDVGPSPSLEIKLDQTRHRIIFIAITRQRTVKLDMPYRPDQWNKVQFVYNGVNDFKALVQPETDIDEIQKKEVVLEGFNKKNPLLKPTMPLRIGSCFRGAWRGDVDDFFHGEMDDIYIASCVPELS